MTAIQRPSFITDRYLDDVIERALQEDVGSGDVTTEATVGPSVAARGVLLAKEDGIVAGRQVVDRIFEKVDPGIRCEWQRGDGETIYRGTAFCTIQGRARSLLTAERLLLNVLQRMSGIASATRLFVDAVRGHPAQILDTRKTAPGLRLLDKWAVALGGGRNHRIGLYDMILIKDNHIAAAGGIREATEAAIRFREGKDLRVEVETRTLEEVEAVLDVRGVDVVLLDNMVDAGPTGKPDVSRLRSAVELIDGRIETEASGNVTLETVRAIAETGVDFISCGALTHSVTALDISLQMTLESP